MAKTKTEQFQESLRTLEEVGHALGELYAQKDPVSKDELRLLAYTVRRVALDLKILNPKWEESGSAPK